MSTEELGKQINEVSLEQRTKGFLGLVAALGIKYGLPALCCIYLFYVIERKDQQIFMLTEKVTAALIENNHALRDVADAVKDLNRNRP